MTDEILLARAFLNRLAEPACIPLWSFVCSAGPVEAARQIRAGTAPRDVLTATKPRVDSADPHADLEAAERHGIRLVVPESVEWPHFAFSALEMAGAVRAAEYEDGARKHAEYGEPIPPLALWARGSADLAALGVRSVGIVGSRAATPYGERIAADLAYGLARRGFTVVSGGAYGIDATAHRAALASGGETVLVSAGGLDRPYPPSSSSLFDRAAESGLVLSESPPGCAPQRRRFLTRNRIIAALSTGTVVVESAHRSGARNTAGHCFRIERPVMVVPGPITSEMSVGCHEMLRDERDPAVLVTSVEHVTALIGGASDVPNPPPPARAGGVSTRDRLDTVDERVRKVFDGFPRRRSAHPDELAAASGLSTLDVIRALPELELSGLVESTTDGYRIRRADT